MSFRDYSTTPGSNTTIGGKNVAEDCNPEGINDALRQLAADGRELADDVDEIDLSGKVDKDGAVFTGTQPKYDGRGALMHHNNAANTSGRIFVQAEGAAVPTMSNGDILAVY